MTAESTPGIELFRLIEGGDGDYDPDVDFLIADTGEEFSLNDLIVDAINDFLGNFDTQNQSRSNGSMAITNRSLGDVMMVCTLYSLVTSGDPASLEMTPDGEIVIVRNHVSVTLAPAPFDRSSFLGGLLGMGILARIDDDGLVSFKIPGVGAMVLRFDYSSLPDNGGRRSERGPQTVVFRAEVNPALQGAYRLKAVYPDGTVQSLPPYIHDPERFGALMKSAGIAYLIDPYSGVVMLMDEGNRILWHGIPDYILLDPAAGVSGIEIADAGDLNGDDLPDLYVGTEKGIQPVYTLP